MAVAQTTGGALRVPVIDIGAFRNGVGERDAVAAAVDRAAG